MLTTASTARGGAPGAAGEVAVLADVVEPLGAGAALDDAVVVVGATGGGVTEGRSAGVLVAGFTAVTGKVAVTVHSGPGSAGSAARTRSARVAPGVVAAAATTSTATADHPASAGRRRFHPMSAPQHPVTG
ncbi:hypothetical protein [Actinosynnema pretiosum]|uniref:Uncharacterized protein n=1 Tax=Actinosynnema pretiosum TaxID=42197 RepID=A0A290Z8Q1_9PSEU|nr:hypothetical protein [Actinosynnema pretiosum]ATE55421.1 hypothetical protein CNX65_20800 [Actinosynnema pretiosum]